MEDQAFMTLLETHRHEFFAFVKRSVWNEANAEDVFCAAVASAYENRRVYRPDSNFRAWMYKILVNKSFAANRQTGRAAVDIDTVDEHYLAQENVPDVGTTEDFDRLVHECGDEVLGALTRLRPIERSCFLLLSLGGYSYREIAEITEVPGGTVVTHLARGRAKLRQWLCDYAAERGVGRSTSPAAGPVPEAKGGPDAQR
jgi:RNA polymerase sigma-70 factor, ECF subfamily